jgi:hypothetical protein
MPMDRIVFAFRENQLAALIPNITRRFSFAEGPPEAVAPLESREPLRE